MQPIPYIPENAPFSAEQRAWLNGFLVGMFSNAAGAAAANGAAATPAEPLLVLYGSQTGTAEGIAKKLAKEAKAKGFAPRVMELNAHASVDISKEGKLVIISSTWGDGEPPDNANLFWSFIHGDSAPRLESVNYAVLALGDKNYSSFCGAGKKIDERLEALGARRLIPRTDCDVDYEAPAKSWLEALWPELEKLKGAGPSGTAIAESSADPAVEAPKAYGRNNPFAARLLTNRLLNKAGSGKDTRHFEISLEGSGLSYEVGDALGVVPCNCPALVAETLDALGFDGEEAVPDTSGEETSLRMALLKQYQITQPPLALLEAISSKSADESLKRLLEPSSKPELDKFLHGREIIDLLLHFKPIRFDPKEFVGHLRKLQPRLYSISSSPNAHPGEVHLTVGIVRYNAHGRDRKGVCSSFLAERVTPESPLPVFVQASHGFKLPKDTDRPVIMVGPGTGIAPFRAFLEERRAVGAKGGNWLLFGDQRSEYDFLYREELEAMKTDGFLARLDTAFSRDQEAKIYVQNRMLESAGELWKWMEAGAHFYVCGDAKRMARDVDQALHQAIEKAGGMSPEKAAEYVAALKKDNRYQRDVY